MCFRLGDDHKSGLEDLSMQASRTYDIHKILILYQFVSFSSFCIMLVSKMHSIDICESSVFDWHFGRLSLVCYVQ